MDTRLCIEHGAAGLEEFEVRYLQDRTVTT